EFKACENTANFLRCEGFNVEVGVAGLATAIKASFGSGKPVIGFMGEFDALPGLSQKVSTKQEAFELGGYGHGCGHNLLC
ncbi:amidohydrolase, partial [Clostridioides difficile]|nr:amidohydrolase [Clostridioides difficile]